MQVSIYSREEMEDIIQNGDFPQNTAVITFYNPGDPHVHYDAVCQDVCYCALEDVDKSYWETHYHRTYEEFFDYVDMVADFIYEMHAAGKDLICQCDYGMSRSAGCAAAILEHFCKRGIEVFADYRRYPNQMVYHKVMQALAAIRPQAACLEHTALYVQDLEAARTFFVRYFGAVSGAMYHNPHTDFSSYFLTFADGARLELMHRPDVTAAVGEHGGYSHIAFSLGSKEAVDALTAQLQADGYAVLSGPRTTGDGYYESCVAGIEGNRLELTV